jgi:hypothetical protein
MLELEMVNLDEIATALSDRSDCEHVWLLDPRTGEVAFWTSDTGIDGSNPVDLEDLDLVAIGALPSSVWYRDMVDFVEGSATIPPGVGWVGRLVVGAPFDGSGTSCTRSTRT